MRVACCDRDWVGADRAHCCRRFDGCGQVFDDAALWDAHRPTGTCLTPATLGLTQTKNGIWRRP
ncbi:FDXHR family putative zinc-binding protein [Pseudonocardia sp. HH130630-07]|uniref:FDXHR family putative zinc-binding protein n=1 Tax=Pseudonocardia sp. HH130630-07 TaxID=1690815 RepID=UPI003FA6BE1D